jgi:hypothetical protein
MGREIGRTSQFLCGGDEQRNWEAISDWIGASFKQLVHSYLPIVLVQ